MEKFRDVYVKRSVVLFGIIITMTSILFGNMNTLNAASTDFTPIGEKVNREYTAFRDASNIPQYNGGVKTGIVKGAQQYFRYIPSDINIREAVYKDRGIDPE